jgi:ATP-dependent RNA helicase DDX19/DBP5
LISNDFQVEVGAHRLSDSCEAVYAEVFSAYGVQVRLADLQGDPNSPLYSVQEFEQLPMCVSHLSVINVERSSVDIIRADGLSHPLLLKGIYSAGFTRPSKIQEKALPMLLGNP